LLCLLVLVCILGCELPATNRALRVSSSSERRVQNDNARLHMPDSAAPAEIELQIVRSGQGPRRSPEALAKGALPSTVAVVVHDENGQAMSLGSGFFVADDVVATCAHVLEGGVGVTVSLQGDQTSLSVAGVRFIDPVTDVALLGLPRGRGTPLGVNGTDEVQVGQDVFVLGNPQGLDLNPASGEVISA